MAEWKEELYLKEGKINYTMQCIDSRAWWRGIFAAEFWLEQEWVQ
jgi:hypothetical protein